MTQAIISKVSEVLKSIDNSAEINRDLIEYIPLHVFKTKISPRTLEELWPNINSVYRKKLGLYLPCYEHYNTPDKIDHIDGPAPSKMQCYGCKNKRKIIRQIKCKKDITEKEDPQNENNGKALPCCSS